jgi:hypothetical protein
MFENQKDEMNATSEFLITFNKKKRHSTTSPIS